MKETISNTSDKRKYILLNYSEGGENWAHRDSNSDGYFPYQGLLMLSNRSDYDGGEFLLQNDVMMKIPTARRRSNVRQ